MFVNPAQPVVGGGLISIMRQTILKDYTHGFLGHMIPGQ